VSKQVTVILGRQIKTGTVGGEKYTVTLRDDTKNACRRIINGKENYSTLELLSFCGCPESVRHLCCVCQDFVFLTVSYFCIIHLH